MLSRVILKRSIKQYRSVIIEHDPNDSPGDIRRRALVDGKSGEGFVKKDGERTRIDVVRVEPVTKEEI